jgi:predicted transcriptional regulator
MTSASTTIRVTTDQRERLRSLAEQRQSSMTEALDAALESLKREQFYREMASAEAALRKDPKGWERYIEERDNWLNADLGK